MESITGSTKWDIFVVYIVLCTVFILFCCVCVIFMFWCCPARDPSGGAALSSGGGRFRGNTTIFIHGSPTATRFGSNYRRASSMRRIQKELESERRLKTVSMDP